MSGINNIQAEGQIYDILAPEIVNDYVEKLGKTCINPNGYTKGSLILATDGSNVQRLYKTTSNISSNQVISEGGNVELKKLEDLFDDLEDALNDEIDDIDTELGNVKQALTNIDTVISENGAKNLLENTATSQVINGITCEVNPSGYPKGCVKISTSSGGATAYTSIPVSKFVQNSVISNNMINGKTLKLSGCPEGGSLSTYFLSWYRYDSSHNADDLGDGIGNINCNFQSVTDSAVYIRINSGTVITTPIIFKPMLTLADQPNSDYAHYVPYAPTNAQLLSYKDNGVLGAKNLLPNNATTQVIGGTLTVTVGADGTITLNGTVPNTNTFIDIYNGISNILETGKSYIISGSPSGLAEADGYLFINGSPEIASKAGNERTFVFDGLVLRTKVSIVLKANISVSNLVFKPMIRLASDTDSTYQPYAMTNRELTEQFAGWKTVTSFVDNCFSGVLKYKETKDSVFIMFAGQFTNDLPAATVKTLCQLPFSVGYQIRLKPTFTNGYIVLDYPIQFVLFANGTIQYFTNTATTASNEGAYFTMVVPKNA